MKSVIVTCCCFCNAFGIVSRKRLDDSRHKTVPSCFAISVGPSRFIFEEKTLKNYLTATACFFYLFFSSLFFRSNGGKPMFDSTQIFHNYSTTYQSCIGFVMVSKYHSDALLSLKDSLNAALHLFSIDLCQLTLTFSVSFATWRQLPKINCLLSMSNKNSF